MKETIYRCDRCGKELNRWDGPFRWLRMRILGSKWLLCRECSHALDRWMHDGKEGRE